MLGYEVDDIVLAITDDGNGFEIPREIADLADGGHFGVIGMSERARRAGGHLKLESGAGEGCTLKVTVPARIPAKRGS